MSITLLTPVLILLIAIFAFANAIVGHKIGAFRAFLRLASAVVATYFSAAICVCVVLFFDESIILELESLGIVEFLNESLVGFADIVTPIACALFSAVLYVPIFVAVFIIFDFISCVVFKLKSKRDKSDKENYLSEECSYLERNSKPIGAAVGATCGVLVAIAFLSPITGALRVGSNIVSLATEVVGEEELALPIEVEDVLSYADDFMVVTLDAVGGGTLFDMATTTNCFGVMTNFRSELKAVRTFGVDNMKMTVTQLFSPGEDTAQNSNTFIECANSSPVIKMLMLVGVREVADAWLAGEEYMGQARPDFYGNYAASKFFDQILAILATSDFDTIIGDFKTLVALFSILEDYESVFATGDFSTIMSAVSSDDMTNKIKDELRRNSHMLTALPAVDEMMMCVFAEEINNSYKYDYIKREELYVSVAEVLTSTNGIANVSTRKDLVVKEVNNALDSYGVSVSEGITEKIASMLIAEFSNKAGAVSKADVEKYIESFILQSDSLVN